MPALAPGLVFEQSIVVTPELTVPGVKMLAHFADMPPVFATAFMVGFVEDSCIAAIRPYLQPGQHSVGIHVDLGHSAATPVGMRVFARVELVRVEGRRLNFQVDCRDEREPIGGGRHERMLIDQARFEARIAGKTAR
jgi:fluoroacetyl-CoA thioesterase